MAAHYNLGNALLAKGRLEEAIATYREALRHEPDHAETHCNLAHAQRARGQLTEALASMRRGHELGSRSPGWRYPSARWVQECERLVELETWLPAVLRGEVTPADATERLELAELCKLKRLYAAAARFHEEALVARPALVANLKLGHRYRAAGAAARAGCGQGEDSSSLDEAARARWRRKALDWLRADLELWRKQLPSTPQAHAAPQQSLQRWKQDSALAGLRDSDQLLMLPEAERNACRLLWADVDEVLKQLEEKARPDRR